jgi:SynChlorMet cassette radical SAM/SPASM protein ScmF
MRMTGTEAVAGGPAAGGEEVRAPSGVPPLAQLYVYLTEGCNLACRHCWLAPRFDPTATRAPVLALDALEQAIAEARPLGLRGVKLTGGEPLLHPRIGEVLEVVEREGLTLNVETNGTLLTPELAQRLAGLTLPRPPHVSVSLDGADAETHDAVRGVDGAFGGATRAVRSLVDAGVRTQVVFTLMRANEAQLEAVMALVKGLGAESLKVNVLQPTARGERLHDDVDALTVEEYIRIGRRVERELAPALELRVYFDYPAAFRPLGRVAGPYDGRCGIHGILGVLASGHYALCGIGEQLPELVFGTVGETELADLWTSHPVLRSIREGLPERLEGVCGECLLSRACLGSCVAQNYYRNKDLFAPFWFCEEADRAGLFPASRRR